MSHKVLVVMFALVLALQVGSASARPSTLPQPGEEIQRPADQWNSLPAPASSGDLNVASEGPNLLVNGDFDNPAYPFYWRPTNHFVGGMWYEWFAVQIPEFINGGINHHNVCYPPPDWGICVDDHHNSSQGYIRWGAPFVAGVYQPVSVTPCHYYKFTAYNRNDNSNYHPKVGIDPTGQVLPEYISPDGDGLPLNCPPDGFSKCPNPGLKSPNDLPSSIVWSPEFEHAAYTWAGQSVIAEAVSTTVSVWTYTAPEETGSLSAYWDAASLVEVPHPSGMLASGVLPAPDGTLTGLNTSVTASRATFSWNSAQPAIIQVLYHYVADPGAPIATNTAQFESRTAIDNSWTQAHTVRLTNLRPMSTYDYAILARQPAGNACQTSVLVGRIQTTDMLIPAGTLPPAGSSMSGFQVLSFKNSAYVIWQSAQPSYDQLLYSYIGPITPTLYPTMTWETFLPVVSSVGQASLSTSHFTSKTSPSTSMTTLHVLQLPNLQPYSLYRVAGLSAWNEGDLDKSASAYAAFATLPVETSVQAELSADQIMAHLDLCLTQGNPLDECVNRLRP